MRRLALITALLAILMTTNAQSSIRLNSEIRDPVTLQINNVSYTIDSSYQNIPLSGALFDTVLFLSHPSYKSKILYGFYPDSSYTIGVACCATVDIYPSTKLNYDSLDVWDFERDHVKITKLLIDRPRFSFRTTHDTKDTIYAWNADYACFPKIVEVSPKVTEYGVAGKCYYWTNITTLIFFTAEGTYSALRDDKGAIHDVFQDDMKNPRTLNEIHVRIFDNRHYLIDYNPTTTRLTIEPLIR